MYREDPILVGAIPAVPPNDNTFYFGSYRCGAVWNQLEAAGIPGVQGVWTHGAGGSRFMLVISVKTLYGGPSQKGPPRAARWPPGASTKPRTPAGGERTPPPKLSVQVWRIGSAAGAR